MKRHIGLLAASGLALATHSSAFAKARLNTVVCLTSPSWGVCAAPVTGTSNFELTTPLGLVNVLSGTGIALGVGTDGTYLITGGIYESISWSVSIGSFSGMGVSVVKAYGNGTNSSGTATLSVLGTMTLSVGGVLAVDSSSSGSGTQTATVTVTVNFM